MLIDIEDVKVEDRIRKDFGNIKELADDIKENGLINPPVVTPENNGGYTLIAGERRLRAMKSLGYKQIEVRPMPVKDAEHQLNLEISENETRKDFSKAERIDYARRLERIESLKAKERQGMRTDLTSVENKTEVNRTDDIVAQKLDIGSKDTYRKEKFIVDNKNTLTPEDFADWDEGKLSTNKAFLKIKEQLVEKDNQLAGYKIKVENLMKKEPTVIDKTDYSTINNLKSQLNKLKNEYSTLESKTKLTEIENQRYSKLKSDIEYLTQQRDDINRQINSATELAGLVVEIKNVLEEKLAPIKFKRCVDVLKTDDSGYAFQNISDILEKVDMWSQEMHQVIGTSTFVDVIDE